MSKNPKEQGGDAAAEPKAKPEGGKPEGGKKGGKPAKAEAPKADAGDDESKYFAGYTPYLKTVYSETVVPALTKKFGYKNTHQLPKVTKISLNMGVGDGARDIKILEAAERDLTLIAGQKPIRTRARVSVSAFKVREGMPVGCAVTLRRQKMWDFLHRLIYVALPRVRDFRGLPNNAFDGRGNYSLGVKEHIIFPEVDIQNIASIRGMNVTICTTAKTDAEAAELLRGLGLPMRP